MLFRKLLIILGFFIGLCTYLPLAFPVDINTSSCLVLNNSDRSDSYGSLRYKIDNYNLPAYRFCHDLITFLPGKTYKIRLSKKMKIDNRKDRDCTSDLPGCNDGIAFLVDGYINGKRSVIIDTTRMKSDRCAIEINSNNVTLMGINVIGKQPHVVTRDKANERAVICDNGKNNRIKVFYHQAEGNAVCGNNKVESSQGEECDDGNLENNDGCSSACTKEADQDRDGIIDDLDNCAEIENPEQEDCDQDGIGDACDNDWDNDGVDDEIDNCAPSHDLCLEAPVLAYLSNPDQSNLDEASGDTLGDKCDEDMDGDGVLNRDDKCPAVYDPDQIDEDNDGLGKDCAPNDVAPRVDTDGDGIDDIDDNCPSDANRDQKNTDQNFPNGDEHGDVCDIDDDQDGISDMDEVINGTNPLKPDSDEDGMDDAVDLCPQNPDTNCVDPNITPADDVDGDGKLNLEDNCPTDPNPGQEDGDNDQIGDACDLDNPEADSDHDGKINSEDNCPSVSNAGQEDDDEDEIGNACDPSPQEPAGGTPSAGTGCSLTGLSATSSSGISFWVLSILSMWTARRRKQNKE